MNLGQYILSASMNRRDARLCLVSFPSIAPSLIDFQEERSQTLPCLQLGVPTTAFSVTLRDRLWHERVEFQQVGQASRNLNPGVLIGLLL